jgi:hypothetical protein
MAVARYSSRAWKRSPQGRRRRPHLARPRPHPMHRGERLPNRSTCGHGRGARGKATVTMEEGPARAGRAAAVWRRPPLPWGQEEAPGLSLPRLCSLAHLISFLFFSFKSRQHGTIQRQHTRGARPPLVRPRLHGDRQQQHMYAAGGAAIWGLPRPGACASYAARWPLKTLTSGGVKGTTGLSWEGAKVMHARSRTSTGEVPSSMAADSRGVSREITAWCGDSCCSLACDETPPGPRHHQSYLPSSCCLYMACTQTTLWFASLCLRCSLLLVFFSSGYCCFELLILVTTLYMKWLFKFFSKIKYYCAILKYT